jgi:putative adhesin
MMAHRRLGIVPALVLAGVVVGIGLATRPAEGAEARAVTERVFPLKPGGELVIESQNGRITVEAWNRPEARVQITRIVRANDEKRAREILKDVQADVTVGPEHIGIKSRYPKRTETVGIWDVLGQRVTSMNIHYYVQVPIDTDLTLETSNGDLQVKGISGDIDGQTVNGGIEVRSVSGPVEVSTTNGNIRLASVSGEMRAETTNGEVAAVLTQVGKEVELTTTNGDVKVYLPPTVNAEVDASTTNGRVRVGYPIQREGGSTARMLHGRIGSGGVTLLLRTMNGNIVVDKAGNAKGD